MTKKQVEKKLDELLRKEFIDKICKVKNTKSNKKLRNKKKLRRLEKEKEKGGEDSD